MLKSKKIYLYILLITFFVLLGNVSYATEDFLEYPMVIPSKQSTRLDFSTTLVGNKLLLKESEQEDLPSSFDLRDKINVEVKNQGASQSCWTFSTLSVLETNLSKTTGIDYNFSERHMNYSTTNNFLDGTNPWGYNRALGGGNPFMGLSYMTRGSGPVDENKMPFDAKNENEINLAELNQGPVLKKLENYVLFPQIAKIKKSDGSVIYSNGDYTYTDEEVLNIRNSIKQHIMKYGGVTAVTLSGTGASSGTDYSKYYKYGSTYPSYYCDDPKDSGNHQVTIIGWDDDYSVDNFNVKPSKPGAYLILNSHGKNENYPEGCYYISYEDSFIESCPVGIISATDIDYDNIYQYDPLGNSYNIKLNGFNAVYGANVFTRNSNSIEKLTEISIATLSDVNCEIYVNPTNGEMSSSKFKKVKSGIVSLKSGYTTIKLDEPLMLTGEKFVVAVKYISDNGNLSVGVEAPTNTAWSTATNNARRVFYRCFFR